MKRYFSIYLQFIKLSFSELAAFRSNFYNSVFAHLVWAAFTFLTMFLLTSKTKTVLGWSREELFLLTAVFNAVIGLFRCMFTKNMDTFIRKINYGQLDQNLLKPVDAQFWVSLRYVNLGALPRIPVALGVAAYILHLLHISPNIVTLLVFGFLLACGMVILYSVWFLVMTNIIWFTNLMNLEEFLNVITGSTRYPREIFENSVVFLALLFFPLTLVVTVPTKYLLGKSSPFEIVMIIAFSIGLLICSRLYWKFALRYYTSASG